MPSSLLKHEAKVLLSLKGTRGVPRLISYGSCKGIKFLIMERMISCVNDRSLKQYEKTLDGIENELCDVLKGIHSKGFIHRDVKPDNIMFDMSGNLTLIDYGLATSYRSNKSLSVTRSKGIVGTKAFLGPMGLQGYVCPDVDMESMKKTIDFYRDNYKN
jgi:serine/threonine protein kinase